MSDPMREVVLPAGGAKPIGPYSPAIRAGDFLFVSGTIGMDPEQGKLVEGGAQAETRQALANLRAVLEAGGSSPELVVKTTVFMRDLDQFGRMNEIYGGFFSENPPARSTVEVSNLPGGASVEIEAVALIP